MEGIPVIQGENYEVQQTQCCCTDNINSALVNPFWTVCHGQHELIGTAGAEQPGQRQQSPRTEQKGKMKKQTEKCQYLKSRGAESWPGE